jgi:hypothetical protein
MIEKSKVVCCSIVTSAQAARAPATSTAVSVTSQANESVWFDIFVVS